MHSATQALQRSWAAGLVATVQPGRHAHCRAMLQGDPAPLPPPPRQAADLPRAQQQRPLAENDLFLPSDLILGGWVGEVGRVFELSSDVCSTDLRLHG